MINRLELIQVTKSDFVNIESRPFTLGFCGPCHNLFVKYGLVEG